MFLYFKPSVSRGILKNDGIPLAIIDFVLNFAITLNALLCTVKFYSFLSSITLGATTFPFMICFG